MNVFQSWETICRRSSNHWKDRRETFGRTTPPAEPSSYLIGFTLIELLVVVAIIGVLTGLLVPALDRARASSEQAHCASNLRQLHAANTLYADDHGYYAPAASDINSKSNLQRWHGARTSGSEPFNGKLGPLARYMGEEKMIRRCPGFRRYSDKASDNAFEASCGGYGYNDRGVGSRAYLKGKTPDVAGKGMKPEAIAHPAETLMFCDAAFPEPLGQPEYLIEYSFAEAYRFVNPGGVESGTAYPSIHFRHNQHANIIWCDGHVSSETMSFSRDDARKQFDVGWFGPKDNSLFDPF
jgi:prepilin-type N-terminal cleavage/methylation domain-containing protein/prepilin-type processing-associated H-X9-DG protein